MKLTQKNKMNFLFFLFVSISFWFTAESFVIECETFFTYRDFDYTCDVGNRRYNVSGSDTEITEIRGEHKIGKTDDDVKGIYSPNGRINFIPKDLIKFFKNIEHVWIGGTNIEVVTKEDFLKIGKNLKTIVLSSNKIKHIETGAFEGMENLTMLDLTENPCTSNEHIAREDHSKVLELIQSVEEKCKDPSLIATTPRLIHPQDVFEEEITALSSNLTSTLKILKSKDADAKIQELQEENLTIKTENLKYQEEIKILSKNDENLKEFKNEIIAKFSAIESKLDQLLNKEAKI